MQCHHISKDGNRCSNNASAGGDFCAIHDPDVIEKRRANAGRYKPLPTAELPPLHNLDQCLDALSIVCKEAFTDRKYADAVASIKAAGKLCQSRDDRKGTISASDLAAMGDDEIQKLGSLSEAELEKLREQIAKGRG